MCCLLTSFWLFTNLLNGWMSVWSAIDILWKHHSYYFWRFLFNHKTSSWTFLERYRQIFDLAKTALLWRLTFTETTRRQYFRKSSGNCVIWQLWNLSLLFWDQANISWRYLFQVTCLNQSLVIHLSFTSSVIYTSI